MRARALLSSVVLLSLPFVACGRSEMEDDFELPGIGGAGFGGAPVIDGGGSGGTGNLGGAGGVAGAGAMGGFGGAAGAGAMGGFGGVAGAGAMGGFGGVAGAGAMGGFGGTTGGFGGVGATGGVPVGGFGGTTGGSGGIGAFGGSGGSVTDGGNFFDAFPFPDSGPIFNCVSCAEQNCKNQVNACYNDPACASGVVCAATSCGGFNLQCVLSCFQGKFQAAIKAFQVFTCLAQNCGQSCIGVVTGGGGLPPPGGGGPAPGGGSQTELPPVAGGFSGYVTPEMAASTGLPAGPVYVPSIEVFDAVGR